MTWLGDFPEDYATVPCGFTTHDGNGAPVAPLTAFESADVFISKNGSTIKATTNGLTMTSPFNSKTGAHMLIIDTSNDTGDAGFWTTGGGDVYTIWLWPDTETVNGQTVGKVIGQFRIKLAADTAPTAAVNAAAVWDLDATAHQTQGTFGQAIGDPVADTGTIYKATVTDATGTTVGVDTAAIITTLGAAGAGLTAVPFTNVWSVATRTLTANTNFNDPTAATIAAAVWDLDATGHQTQGTFGQAIGDPASDTNTIFKAVVTDATGATVGLDVVAVQVDVDDIQTRIPAALVGGRIDASVGAMAADTLTAAAAAADFGTEVGTAVWASATRVLTAGTNIQLPSNGLANVTAWTVAITGNITGNLSGSVGSVTGLTASNLDATVSSRLAAVDYTAPDNASIADILADTDELQAEWVNGGRLDNILDARASQTSVDDLPTNAELATALASADDATLAAIAGLNDISASDVETAAGNALATYDGPTRAEATSDVDSVLAVLGTPIVTDLATDIANVQSAVDALAIPSPDDILDNEDGVETGLTLRQGLRLLVAEATGKGTGLNGSSATFYAPDGITVRITGDVDPDAGTRDNVVLTP